MNSAVDERFATQVIDVCQVYHAAPQWAEQLVRVVSTDEMTGVQALERKAPDLAMTPARRCVGRWSTSGMGRCASSSAASDR